MNPFLTDTKQPFNSIPFNLIKAEHFLPAIKHCIKITEANIENIISNKNPNFDNTILALEFSTEDLDEIVTVFRHLFGSEADEEALLLAATGRWSIPASNSAGPRSSPNFSVSSAARASGSSASMSSTSPCTWAMSSWWAVGRSLLSALSNRSVSILGKREC